MGAIVGKEECAVCVEWRIGRSSKKCERHNGAKNSKLLVMVRAANNESETELYAMTDSELRRLRELNRQSDYSIEIGVATRTDRTFEECLEDFEDYLEVEPDIDGARIDAAYDRVKEGRLGI